MSLTAAEQVCAAPQQRSDEAFTVVNEVQARPRPGLDPIGARLGSFQIFPSLRVTAGYDDNVYDWNSYRRKSTVLAVQPQVTVRSTWSRHEVHLQADGTFQRYPAEDANNFDQYRISAGERVDLGLDSALNLDSQYIHGVEPRGTAGDVVAGGEPTRYRSFGSTGRFTTRLGALAIEAGADITRLKYSDVDVGTTRISQAYRNRTRIGAMAQAGLAVGPSLSAFVRGGYDDENYDRSADVSGFGSHGWTLLAGADFRVTQLIGGRVGVGYLRRSYDNPAFSPVAGFNYYGHAVWNVTTLVSLTFDADKAILESPQIGVSGIVRNHGEVSADWEVLRRLIATARLSYATERYRGYDRTDKRSEAGMGLRYLANRFVEFGLRYDHRHQASRGAFGRRYTDNEIALSLTLQR